MFLKNIGGIAIYQIRILSTASFCHFLSFLFAKHITRYFHLKFHLGVRCKDGPSLGCPTLVNIFYVFYFKGKHMADNVTEDLKLKNVVQAMLKNYTIY